MVTRRNFLTATSAIAAGRAVKSKWFPDSPPVSSGERPPNILIFMPDQQQGQTILPDHPCKTPRVDRFVKEGLLFPNAFCPAPHCCPSRASFQTGKYPSEHGVFNNVATDSAIHTDPYPDVKFFSDRLRKAGYDLGYAGKWHVGLKVTPESRGWTNFTPTPLPGEVYVEGAERRPAAFTKARAELRSRDRREEAEVFRPGWGDIKLYRTLPAANSVAEMDERGVFRNGLDGLKKMTAGRKPWCMMISNNGVHDLYAAPKNYVDMYDWKSIPLPPNFHDTLADKPNIYGRMRFQYWAQLSDDEIRKAIAHYWAKATVQDTLFGILLDQLEESGQADNTLVVYVSDHGDYAGAHGLWAKGVPAFREAYNIPCAIRWPRGIKNPGRRVDAFVCSTDFAPTFIEAARIPAADFPCSGKSLLPWFRDEQPKQWRDAVYSQMNGVELYYTQRIVMTKDYKYVYNGFDYDEMYDLRNDPHEMVNLAHPDLKAAQANLDAGRNLADDDMAAWPPLAPELATVRRDMLNRMWNFAEEHKDQIFNNYITVAMAPYGPGLTVGGD